MKNSIRLAIDAAMAKPRPICTPHTHIVPRTNARKLRVKDEADYNKRRDEDAGVYLIGSTEHGWYKIGQSSEVNRRIRHYTSMPFVNDVSYVWRVKNNDCRRVEIALHSLVEDRRLRANGGYSEWFTLSPDDVNTIAQFMADQRLFNNGSPTYSHS
jgi:hypothetical protein